MRNFKFLSFIGINPKPFNPNILFSTTLTIIVFLIITFDPITQSLPILTSCSIIVLGPIPFEPILTFLPIKTLFPNFTDLNFLIGFLVINRDNLYQH